MLIGIGLVVAAFAALVWIKRRSQAARHERPPLRTKILRPPGYSLTCRIDELAEKLTVPVMQAVCAGALLGLTGSAFYPLMEGLVLRRFTLAEIRLQPVLHLAVPRCLGLVSTCMDSWELDPGRQNSRQHPKLSLRAPRGTGRRRSFGKFHGYCGWLRDISRCAR